MLKQTLDLPQLIIDPAMASDREERDLNVFFRPRSVAVIGATDKPGHVGRAILSNLLNSPFGGAVYPVNPKRKSVLGVRSCPSISQIPEPVDLAVVVTPAKSVPGVIEECSLSGVRGAVVIISAGFRETGEQGVDLEAQFYQLPGRVRCGSWAQTAWASCALSLVSMRLSQMVLPAAERLRSSVKVVPSVRLFSIGVFASRSDSARFI